MADPKNPDLNEQQVGEPEDTTATDYLNQSGFVQDVDDLQFGEPASDPSKSEAPGQEPKGTQEPKAPALSTEPSPAEKLEQDRRYWQSEADRYRNAYEGLAPYAPLIQQVQSTQDGFARVMSALVTPGNPANQPGSPSALVAPQPPERPPDYDHSAALSDPSSSSHKYLVEMDKYRTDVADYLLKRDMMRERAQEQMMQEALRQRQAQQLEAETKRNLAVKGIVGQEADDFIRSFTEGEYELDDYVALWQARKGRLQQGKQPYQQPSPAQQQARQVIQQQRGAPLPLGALGGGNEEPEPELDDNKKMTLAFLQAGKGF